MNVEQEPTVAEVIERSAGMPGALLPILHDLQEVFGFVSDEAVVQIAHALNLSRAEVHGVVSFYHTFRRKAPGRYVVQICRAESCQSMGARALEAHAQQALETKTGETSADGRVTLEPVYCLGNCACSPSIRIDRDVFGFVDEARFDELMESLS